MAGAAVGAGAAGAQAAATQWDPNLVDTMPFPVTKDVLVRGQERFNIYCSPCHDRVASGNGIVVQRGYLPPPTFHSDRLRSAPVGHFFDVMTNGFGAMPSYALQVPVRDRWNIAAYIRALQLSQNATINDVPPDQRNQLQSGAAPGGTSQPGATQPGASATGTSPSGASATATP